MGMAGTGGATGIDVEQFCGRVADFFGRLAFGFGPVVGAKFVERHFGFRSAAVAADQVQVGDGHIELVSTCVLQGQQLVRCSVNRQCL